MRLASILLFALLPLAATAEDNSALKANTMTVRGEAVTKVAPDQLTLPVTVREENPNLQAAKKRHDEKLTGLLALAEKNGIPKDKIETSAMQINPVYDYEKDSSRPRLRGYEVETSLEFRLTDFAKLGDFMNGVIGLNIDTIGSINYCLQDEEKVKDDTLNHAMEHAYAKASRLAATAKVTLDRPFIIEEGDVDIQRPPFPRPMFMNRLTGIAAPAQAPELPPGLIEIHQTVTVTYSLK
jgi:uncharacterized protein